MGCELNCGSQSSTEQGETKGKTGEHSGELGVTGATPKDDPTCIILSVYAWLHSVSPPPALLSPTQVVGYVSRQSSNPGPGKHPLG